MSEKSIFVMGLIIVICACFLALGIFLLWSWQNPNEQFPFRCLTTGIFCIGFSVILAVFGILISVRKNISINELVRFVSVYPKAEYVLSFKDGKTCRWMFDTKDTSE